MIKIGRASSEWEDGLAAPGEKKKTLKVLGLFHGILVQTQSKLANDVFDKKNTKEPKNYDLVSPLQRGQLRDRRHECYLDQS